MKPEHQRATSVYSKCLANWWSVSTLQGRDRKSVPYIANKRFWPNRFQPALFQIKEMGRALRELFLFMHGHVHVCLSEETKTLLG
jgi:hypothetical protein